MTEKARANQMKNHWMAAILETLLELPPMERDVFVLSRYQSLGLKEIGAKFSIPVAHAEALLFAANEKEVKETDVVLALSPHIIRNLNITSDDEKMLWLGIEEQNQGSTFRPYTPIPSVPPAYEEQPSEEENPTEEIPETQEETNPDENQEPPLMF